MKLADIQMDFLNNLNLADFNATCTKAEGRDKLARFFQYAARFLFGFTTKLSPKTGSRLKEINEHSRSVMVQLASARRTHRWCKEFPVIQSIPKCFDLASPVDVILDLLQKTSLATFMIIDHFGFLKQVKILKGGKRAGSGTIQLGLKFFTFSNIVAAVVQAKKYFKLKMAEEIDASKGEVERWKCIQLIFKHLLLAFQVAHLSLLYQTGDTVVGLAGMVTSLMDVDANWPKPAPKPVANAKPDAK